MDDATRPEVFHKMLLSRRLLGILDAHREVWPARSDRRRMERFSQRFDSGQREGRAHVGRQDEARGWFRASAHGLPVTK